MRVRSKSRFSPRVSKRKIGIESSSTAASEPQPKRTSKRNESEHKESSSSATRCSTVSSSVVVDKYCWLCHTETDDKICVTCHRSFHNSCLAKPPSASFSELGVCPECQSKSVDGTELNSSKYFNLDKLKRMLDVLTRRSFDKKRGKNEPFLRWPEEDRDKLFKIIDFEILLDNINHVLPYTKTAEFYGDVKFIYHNSCIVYGANSDQAKAAENLRKDFKTELLDLEACPECYYHLYCDESDSRDPFMRLCDSPHDIVWAQLTGHPYWPAKCLKVVKGFAHVRFFGEHEQSKIPINKCFFMSETYPKNKNSNLSNPENSGPKSPSFKSARTELLRYIRLYERRYGTFPFYSHKTPYKPQERQNEVIIISAEGSSNRNMAEMKLEGIVNEDSEANVLNAATVMEFSEENLPPNSVSNDIASPNESFKELPFTRPEGNENLIGGFNNNPSPVTSINMSFSSDENPSNIENVPRNPVVTSIESLQPTESPPIALSSAGDSSLDCDFRLLENIKGILNSAASKVSETINCTEILSATVANNASDDSPIQSDSLHNIMNNFSVFTGNQAELDNEVQCIGQKRNIEADEPINPDIIVSLLEENSPELKDIFKKARYWINGILLTLWASCNENPDNLGRISKLCVDLRKCRSDLKKMEEENDKIKKEEAENKYQIQSLTNQLNKLQSENEKLESKLTSEIEKNVEARENAKTIIRSLKSGCSKRIEEMLKKQFMDTIEEKEKKLEYAEETIKTLEEEKKLLEKELAEAKIAKQNAEEKLSVTKSPEFVYDRDDIATFKKTHYCCVCEVSAAFVCCLNTSYCSPKCQEEHAEEHQPHCKREISSQIVQQTVCQKTVVYSVERSTINNSSNPEISNTESMADSTQPKKTDNSASSVVLTPQDHVIASSSRSNTSKSKRRSRK
ncbi:unnamed protein product [Larinioides sclopetarius]|uniref:Uncharacterized protein n=1 Tax=Larinioides sclopetarius TaxID=280406 RepID=A0AAV2BZ25_9ARAC